MPIYGSEHQNYDSERLNYGSKRLNYEIWLKTPMKVMTLNVYEWNGFEGLWKVALKAKNYGVECLHW